MYLNFVERIDKYLDSFYNFIVGLETSKYSKLESKNRVYKHFNKLGILSAATGGLLPVGPVACVSQRKVGL